jgi:hypothetical protein
MKYKKLNVIRLLLLSVCLFVFVSFFKLLSRFQWNLVLALGCAISCWTNLIFLILSKKLIQQNILVQHKMYA